MRVLFFLFAFSSIFQSNNFHMMFDFWRGAMALLCFQDVGFRLAGVGRRITIDVVCCCSCCLFFLFNWIFFCRVSV